MGITIKDIAKEAGVSIATVSHALNKTRYVSPELVEKIQQIASEFGYVGKHEPEGKIKNYRLGKLSEIALVVPDIYSIAYTNLISKLSKALDEEGYMLAIYLLNGGSEQEKHIIDEIITNKRVAGIILNPTNSEKKYYKKLIASSKPFVCLESTIGGDVADSIVSDNLQGVRRGVEHLIKCGHERIALFLEDKPLSMIAEYKQGYIEALEAYGITYDEHLVSNIIPEDGQSKADAVKLMLKMMTPTAILAGGNTLTLRCLKAIDEMGLQCPKDISVVGFGNDNWCELINPPLTTLAHNTEEIERHTVSLLLDHIKSSYKTDIKPQTIKVPMELTIRKSILNIARGPFGEKIVYPEENFLSEEEVEALKKGKYTVAISFHYSGNEWTRLHEKAIKDTLNNLGVRVLAITDANFDPDLQNTQIEGLVMQHPDAIIAVPADEIKTAAKFKEISRKTKLILINNIPNSLKKGDYSCWISVNERENGQNAAQILKEHFADKEHVKIGMLVHGTSFFATKQRDFFAEQVFRDNCPNINVVSKRNFYTIDNTYDICRRMIQDHPEIQGLYITWERPALQAIRALEDLGRTDIAITTTDLDYEIASYMAKGRMVVGLSSQRPYDQGVAVATATAKALLGNNENSCIGVQPYTVTASNLEKSWKEILKTKVPEF